MTPVLLLGALAVAQPQPAADEFVAVGPASDRTVGRVVKLSPDFLVEIASPAGVTKVADVVSLRRVGAPLPAFPRGPVLLTTTGDRVPGRLLGGDAQAVRFKPTAARDAWDVPLPAVAVVWTAVPPAATPADTDRVAWLGANRKRDLLRFRNGDVVPGAVVGFTDDGDAVRFKPDAGEERAVALASVGAVAFNPALASARRPKGAYSHVVLRDGTRLDLTGATANDATLRGKTLFGQAVALPLGDVVAIDTARGKATDLSVLRPKAEAGAFLGTAWPWAADRTVRGEPLRLLTPLGVETFDRGLGTHPRAALTYELGGKYRRFEALVGLDPATGRQGRAVVRVVVDGKDQPVPAGLADLVPGVAVELRVELAGATRMTLAVEAGAAGDVQADVNWADARLFE